MCLALGAKFTVREQATERWVWSAGKSNESLQLAGPSTNKVFIRTVWGSHGWIGERASNLLQCVIYIMLSLCFTSPLKVSYGRPLSHWSQLHRALCVLCLDCILMRFNHMHLHMQHVWVNEIWELYWRMICKSAYSILTPACSVFRLVGYSFRWLLQPCFCCFKFRLGFKCALNST